MDIAVASTNAMALKGIGRLASIRLFAKCKRDYSQVYVEMWRRFGYVSYLYLPMKRMLFFHPDHVRYILRDNAKNYRKSSDYEALKPAMGEGLVTSEGELWRRQRSIIAPEFQRKNVIGMTKLMSHAVADLISDWEDSARKGEIRDLHADLMRVGFRIAGETLFGQDLKEKAEEARSALTSAIEEASSRMMSVLRWPLSIPTPANRRYLRAIAVLEKIINEVIDKRVAASNDNVDIISRLIGNLSQQGNTALDRKLLRDEVMTLLLAGHETTAVTLSWAIWELSNNPTVAENLFAETNSVLKGGLPTAEYVNRLPYARMVIEETLRKNPAVPMLPRVAINDDEVGGYFVAANTVVTCSQTVTHNDPAFWEEPERFLPERFSSQKGGAKHPFSYFPFGTGPRVCLGETMAMTEMVLMLAGISQYFKFELDPTCPIIPQAAITLRPKYGLRARILRR